MDVAAALDPSLDYEQERNNPEITSRRKRNGSSVQGGNGPNLKRFRIITEEEGYKWSLPQDMASTQMIIQKNLSQKKTSKRPI